MLRYLLAAAAAPVVAVAVLLVVVGGDVAVGHAPWQSVSTTFSPESMRPNRSRGLVIEEEEEKKE